jgi:hypothetical protein
MDLTLETFLFEIREEMNKFATQYYMEHGERLHIKPEKEWLRLLLKHLERHWIQERTK